MSSGSFVRGSVSAPTATNPVTVYRNRTWSGGDSIVVRKERHPVERIRVQRGQARKVSYTSTIKTKSGKLVSVKREMWVVDRVRSTVTGTRNQFIRITDTSDAAQVYPTSIVNLLPNALRKREDDAGLNRRDDVSEVLARPSSIVNKDRPPKRARLKDNNYSMSETYMRRVYCEIPNGYRYQTNPDLCTTDVPSKHDSATWAGDWSAANLMNANDEIKLVNKLREKLIGSDFNAAVALGELHESVDLIVNSATRIARYMHAMKRGHWSTAHHALFEDSPKRRESRRSIPSVKEVASKHLELEYGWKPLLNDVVGGAEALAHALNTPVQMTYRVSRTTRQPQKWLFNRAQTPCNPGFVITTLGQKEQRVGLIARFREKPSLPKLLGLLDPEVVAWELVPFSFVADWFLPLGDWLTARGFAQGLDATFVRSDKRTGKAFQASGSRLQYAPVTSGPGLLSQVQFTRTVSSSLNVPKPTVKPLSQSLSWARMTNAVALLISNHGGRGYK